MRFSPRTLQMVRVEAALAEAEREPAHGHDPNDPVLVEWVRWRLGWTEGPEPERPDFSRMTPLPPEAMAQIEATLDGTGPRPGPPR
jgi:hypothetical protein